MPCSSYRFPHYAYTLLRSLSPYLIPPIIFPFPFPMLPICYLICSPPYSNSPYSDSQLPWFEIIILRYMLTLLLSLPPPPHTWCTCVCHRIFGSLYIRSHLLHQFTSHLKFKWQSLCRFWSNNMYMYFYWSKHYKTRLWFHSFLL